MSEEEEEESASLMATTAFVGTRTPHSMLSYNGYQQLCQRRDTHRHLSPGWLEPPPHGGVQQMQIQHCHQTRCTTQSWGHAEDPKNESDDESDWVDTAFATFCHPSESNDMGNTSSAATWDHQCSINAAFHASKPQQTTSTNAGWPTLNETAPEVKPMARTCMGGGSRSLFENRQVYPREVNRASPPSQSSPSVDALAAGCLEAGNRSNFWDSSKYGPQRPQSQQTGGGNSTGTVFAESNFLRSLLAPRDSFESCRQRLVDSMMQSRTSQLFLHEWDSTQMGLKRSHSKTMRLSTESRNDILMILDPSTVEPLYPIHEQEESEEDKKPESNKAAAAAMMNPKRKLEHVISRSNKKSYASCA